MFPRKLLALLLLLGVFAGYGSALVHLAAGGPAGWHCRDGHAKLTSE